jgi:hypothetical protein
VSIYSKEQLAADQIKAAANQLHAVTGQTAARINQLLNQPGLSSATIKSLMGANCGAILNDVNAHGAVANGAEPGSAPIVQ